MTDPSQCGPIPATLPRTPREKLGDLRQQNLIDSQP